VYVSLDHIIDVRGDELVVEGEIVISNLENCLPLRQRILGRGEWWGGRWFLLARQMDTMVMALAVVLVDAHTKGQRDDAWLCRSSRQIR
jgi:hypothetical protein